MNNFMQYCQLCTSDENVLFTELDLDSDGKRFVDKLEVTVPKIVDCKIKLPNGICTICAVRLNDAYKFIKQCFDSQIILKQHLNEERCRLCAGDDNITYSLTTMDTDNVLLSYKLETIASEILQCTEKLSDCICSICSVRLNETYKYVEKCFQSHEILMRYAEQQSENSEVMKNEINNEEENKESLESQNNINFEIVYVKEEPISDVFLESESLDSSEIINKEEYLNFKNAMDLQRRNSNENHESVMKRKFNKCPLCEETFTQSRSLKKHIYTHTNERPFKCEICEKTFLRNEHLKVHFRIHTNEKPFKCEICEKTFARNENLKRHSRTHTNERPYKCDICEKQFTRSGNLIKHFRTHTNERPYKCEICEKQFTRRENLTTHFRTHTKERRYRCRICEKAFIRSDNLKRHMRSHANEISDESKIENFSAE